MEAFYWNWNVFLAVTLAFVAVSKAQDCSFNETVLTTNCKNLNLTAFPTVNTNTTSLDISGNNLTFINSTHFENLTNLVFLELSGNQLTELPNNAFESLTNLVYLHLGQNQITTIRAKAFNGLVALEELHMETNRLSSLSGYLGSDLGKLTMLHVSDNVITTIGAQDLDNLVALQTLDLSGNKISTIDPLAFSANIKLATVNLQGNNLTTVSVSLFENTTVTNGTLNLSDNIWKCDCALYNFTQTTAGNGTDFNCSSPEEFKDRMLSNITKPELCEPVSPPSASTETSSTVTPATETPSATPSTETPSTETPSTETPATDAPAPQPPAILPSDTKINETRTAKTAESVTIRCKLPDTSDIKWFLNNTETKRTEQRNFNATDLTVTNATYNDSGSYCCGKVPSPTYCVEVTVKSPESPPPPAGSSSSVVVVVVVLVLVAVVLVAGCYVYRRWKRNQSGESYGLLNDDSAFRPTHDRGSNDFL